MLILLMIHSIVRWLIVIVALVTAVKFAWGWLRGGTFQGMDRGLMSGFTGLIDLQAAFGLIYFLWSGFAVEGFPTIRFEHAGIMLVAAVVAHLHVIWKKSEDKIRFRNSLFIILDTLIIVFIGVAILPGGWSR